ncbi:hypothetical protein EK904_012403 [Melospiza melodia maxima]|nr:hypothetical protein EK904_012403 [Melospiza melodia maxima]
MALYYKKSKNTDDANWNTFLIELCLGYRTNCIPLLSRIPKFSPLKFLPLDISSNYQFSNRPDPTVPSSSSQLTAGSPHCMVCIPTGGYQTSIVLFTTLISL